MADQSAETVRGGGGARGGRGFGRGRRGERRGRGEGGDGDRRGDRRGRRGDRGRRGGRGGEEGPWTPLTKLGRLVKDGKIKYLEEIYLHSLPVKEFQIIDYFLKDKLKDEVMKISPVQKQTRAGQRTRFKAVIVVGDSDGHIGLGEKLAKEVANAIKGAIQVAKLTVIPVRRGYWGNRIGKPHTVPCKVNGKCGSVNFRLIPAPRGTGIVAAPAPKKVLTLAGIQDVYTQSRGKTATQQNFVKATFDALRSTYGYLTPDLWPAYEFQKSPLHEFTDFLADTAGQEKDRKD